MEESFTELGYQKLVQDIFRRFPSVQKDGFTAGAYKPGLERMEAFDQALGNPSRKFRSIHVAGTNGKGSVANMLASALSACGLRTGLFTSPHLMDFRERMVIAGGTSKGEEAPKGASAASLIPKEYVFQFLNRWMPWIIQYGLSFFEITTALAFKWFEDMQVDVAVIEVGLGGRLDSTNILVPELSIITTIGLDHCELLGNTLPQVAAEKAGIFKRGVPALVGETQAETAPVFKEKAWMFCPLTFADEQSPTLWNRHREILKEMDLRADVQEKNLRTVLCALDILRDGPLGLALGRGLFGMAPDWEDTLVDGIVHTAARMGFHGRWERLSTQPYVLADIGHNPQALDNNFRQLEKLVARGDFSSLIIVYGIMADKDLDAILPLMPRNATYIFTTPQTPRALPADDILEKFRAFSEAAGDNAKARTFAFSSVRQAVQMAIQLAQRLGVQLSRSASAETPAPPLIYIGGSTFVVAEALPLFRR